MKPTPYLFEQNNRFYYKRRVNKEQVFVGSLKTDSLLIAKQIVAIINIKTYELFGGAENMTDNEEYEYIRNLLKRYISEAIVEYSRLEAKRHNAYLHNGKNGASPETIEKVQEDMTSKMYSKDAEKLFNEIFPRTNISKAEYQILSEHGKENFRSMLLKEELNILQFDKERNKKYLQPSFMLQNSHFSDLYITNFPSQKNSNDNNVDLPQVEVLPAAPTVITVPSPQHGGVNNKYYRKDASQIRDSFLAKKKRERILDYVEYEKTTTMFLEFCGEKYLFDIQTSVIDEFVEHVFEMPKNSGKLARDIYAEHFPDLRAIVSLGRKHSLPVQNVKTANKKIIYAHGLLEWAYESEYLDRNRLNNRLVNTKKNTEKYETYSRKQVLFSDEMLNNLLHSTWYSNIGETLKTEPWKIYIPLVLMYHSFRLNEVCSLSPYQILEPNSAGADGYWCFKTWKGKNYQSARIIPIHQKLIDLHFIDYCKLKKASKSNNLWDLEPNESHGHRESVTKAFNKKEFKGEFIPGELLENSMIRFDTHSFRHLIGTKLKSKANAYTLNAVFGHKGRVDQTDEYGENISIDEKADTLSKLIYNIDTTHIENYFSSTPKKDWFE